MFLSSFLLQLKCSSNSLVIHGLLSSCVITTSLVSLPSLYYRLANNMFKALQRWLSNRLLRNKFSEHNNGSNYIIFHIPIQNMTQYYAHNIFVALWWLFYFFEIILLWGIRQYYHLLPGVAPRLLQTSPVTDGVDYLASVHIFFRIVPLAGSIMDCSFTIIFSGVFRVNRVTYAI